MSLGSCSETEQNSGEFPELSRFLFLSTFQDRPRAGELCNSKTVSKRAALTGTNQSGQTAICYFLWFLHANICGFLLLDSPAEKIRENL